MYIVCILGSSVGVKGVWRDKWIRQRLCMHCFFSIFNMKAETYLRDNFLEQVPACVTNPLSMAPAKVVGKGCLASVDNFLWD